MTTESLIAEARIIPSQPEDNRNTPHAMDAHGMDLPEWLEFQHRFHLLHYIQGLMSNAHLADDELSGFLHRRAQKLIQKLVRSKCRELLTDGGQLSHVQSLGIPADEDALRAVSASQRVMRQMHLSRENMSFVTDPRLRVLQRLPAVRNIIDDWQQRFGPLFRNMCKYQQVAAEDASAILAVHQRQLIDHILLHQRIEKWHTGKLPTLSDVLARVRSRISTGGEDEYGAYLECST